MDPNMNMNEFLDGAKAAIQEASALGAQVSELRKEHDLAQAGVNALIKDQEEQISKANQKKVDEINKTYDGEINKCNSLLRKAQSRRAKAKDQGVRERITEETADLKADIKAIRARTKADFKAQNIPAYCESGFFNALYFPDSIGDAVTILITFVIVFFVIPYGIYKLFFDGSTAALIIIYIIDVLLFGGIYIAISRKTVMVHTDVLRRAKTNQKAIDLDRKKIKTIIRQIREDKNESYYDLAKYDDDIAHIKQELADITMKKNDAINTFETVTKNIIADEIIAATKPAIEEAQSKLADVTERFKVTEAARKLKVQELTDNYQPYLGKELMNCKKLDDLQAIVNHGTVTNINEAIEEYNRQYDI